jgi:hypothetical protein
VQRGERREETGGGILIELNGGLQILGVRERGEGGLRSLQQVRPLEACRILLGTRAVRIGV